MRVLLDAHPDVRCGEETHVIPELLGKQRKWAMNSTQRLLNAGITNEVLDTAVAAFIKSIIVGHGEPSSRLCNKDPLTMASVEYLASIFPRAKFIFMVRDGRASVASMMTRKVRISGYNLNDPIDCLTRWNRAIEKMYNGCNKVGRARCLPVHYEQLVLHPRGQLGSILQFLDLTWNETLLHHETLIGSEISIAQKEPSTSQVVKPLNVDALTSWVGHFSDDIIANMTNLAPMLGTLGYNISQYPPNYGKPDKEVVEKTEKFHAHAAFWEQRAINIRAGNESSLTPMP